MNGKSSVTVAILTIFGVAIGSLLGYLVPSIMLATSFLGSLYLGVLILIALPLFVTSISAGITFLGGPQKFYRTAGKSAAYFGLTGLGAVILGALAVHLIRPGVGANISSQAVGLVNNQPAGISEFLNSFFGMAPLGAIGIGQFLPVILLAIIFGLSVVSIIGRSTTLVAFIRESNQVLSRLIHAWSYAAPIGLASLVGTALARNRGQLEQMTGSFGFYFLTVILTFLIFGAIILPLLLKIFGKVSIGLFSGRSIQALMTAFGTGSSAISFPVTYHNATVNNEIDERAASITLPLGTALNFGITAMFTIMAAIFLVQAFGLELGYGQMMMVSFVAMLLSLGTAGLPGITGAVLLVTLTAADISIVNQPGFAPAVGALLLLDLLLFDRLRAMLNVWSDSVGAAVIAQTFEMKTARTGTDGYKSGSSRERSPQGRDRRPQSRSSSQSGRPDRRTSGGRYDRGNRYPDSGSNSGSNRSERRSTGPRENVQSRRPQDERRQKADSISPFNMAATSSLAGDLESGEPFVPKTVEVKKPESPTPRYSSSQSEPAQSSNRSNSDSGPVRTARRPSPRRSSESTSDDQSPRAPRPRRNYRTEQNKDSGPAAPSTFEREKERVTSQLSNMQQEESRRQSEPARPMPTPKPEEREQPVIPAAPKVSTEVRTEPVRDSSPVATNELKPETAPKPETREKPDYSERVVPESRAENRTEERETEKVPELKSESKPEPTTYGRGRTRKFAKPDAGESSESDKKESVVVEDSGYTSNDISFGRSKKKRIR